MKRFFLILAALVFFGISVNAQTYTYRWTGYDSDVCYRQNREIELYSDGACAYALSDGWYSGSYTIENQDGDYIIIIKLKGYQEIRGDVFFNSNKKINTIVIRGGHYIYSRCPTYNAY